MVVVSVSLHLQPRAVQVAAELEQAMNTPGEDLAPAALAIARVEYPSLETSPTSNCSTRWRRGLDPNRPCRSDPVRGCGPRVQRVLYDEQGFRGNRDQWTIRATAF